MKKIPLLFAVITLSLGACTEGNEMILDDPGVNQWIHKTMVDNYLWSATLPNIEATNVNTSPYTYFDSYLRYRKDRTVSYRDDAFGDRFSRIEYLSDQTESVAKKQSTSGLELASKETTYDFGIGIRTFESYSGNVNYIQVIYVIPQSPADLAGIKRGDRISKINNLKMPANKGEVVSMLNKQNMTVTLSYPVAREVALSKAEYLDTPIIFDSIFDSTPKTAYLVYNHFTKGESNRYINSLNRVFTKFKQAGVESIILDLRYNGGGELDVARHLASLIAREDMLGQTLIYKETKGSYGNKDKFSSEDFIGANGSDMLTSNINAKRVCILASKNTASASELIMHALKPYYGSSMMVVGEESVGKNLGSIEITNKRYRWKIKPITIRVYNSNKQSGYEEGIAPDIALTELAYDYPNIGKFGNVESEALINSALHALHPEKYNLISRVAGRSATTSGGEAERLPFSTYIEDRGLIVDRIEVY